MQSGNDTSEAPAPVGMMVSIGSIFRLCPEHGERQSAQEGGDTYGHTA